MGRFIKAFVSIMAVIVLGDVATAGVLCEGLFRVAASNSLPALPSVFPNRIVKLALASKQTRVYMQRLGEDGTGPTSPIVQANLEALFPEVSDGERIKTSDYRYRLFIDEQGTRVEIAPHTLMLMGEIVSTTRMVLKGLTPRILPEDKVLSSLLFRDPITRLRFYEGISVNVTAEEGRELGQVGRELREGARGISSDDVDRWLGAAVTAAATAQSKYTLTPKILLNVFMENLAHGLIEAHSSRESRQWTELADEVVVSMLMPRLKMDVGNALAELKHLSSFKSLVDFMLTGKTSDAVASDIRSVTQALHAIGYNDVAITDVMDLIQRYP